MNVMCNQIYAFISSISRLAVLGMDNEGEEERIRKGWESRHLVNRMIGKLRLPVNDRASLRAKTTQENKMKSRVNCKKKAD